MKKSLKNKILIGVPVIFITVMLIITVVVSVILSKQDRKTAHTLLQNTLNIVRYTISERQEKLLFDSNQMASSGDIGGKVKYVIENNPLFEYDTMRPTYVKITTGIYDIGITAGMWKANIYDTNGDLMSFIAIEENGSTLGHIYNREIIEIALLKPNEELTRRSWLKQDSLPAGIKYHFSEAMPDKKEVHFKLIGGSLCLVAYVPIMGKNYNPVTERIEAKRIGTIMTAQKLDNAFVKKMSELSGTDINIFAADTLIAGTYPDYKKFDFRGLEDAEQGYALAAHSVTFNSVDLVGGSYFQGILPIYHGSECIAAIVSLYSKDITKAGTVQIIKLLSLIYLVGILLIVPITILVVVRGIINPIARIASMMREIAHKKDFTKMLHIESQDEIGELAASFNEMNENLRQSTTSIDNLNREIEERKKAQERLRRAEERYRIQFEGALDAIYVADAETGVLIDVNLAGTELVDREKSELVGKSHLILHPPEKDRGEFHETFGQHLGEKHGQTLETQVITKTGEIREVAIKANLLEVGGKKVLQGIFRDITERKLAEKALLRSEERFKQVAGNAGEWIWEIDTEGLYTYSSPIVEEILGYKPEEIVEKKHFYDFFAPDVKDELRKAALEAFSNRESIRGLINPNVHKNGSTVILETNGTPIIDDEGNLFGYRGADRDITERRRAEEALQLLNVELEATVEKLSITNRELADFAYVTAHDLKAPLRAIGSLTGIISADYADKLDERGKELLDKLVNRTVRMSNQISSILHYSEIGQIEEIKDNTDLNIIVSEVISDIDVPENVEVTIENELPLVICDKTRISQVFQNLVDNAIKHMDKPQGWIRISCVEEDDWFKFSVSDNGSGIDEKYFGKIFQIFQTLTRRDEREATGVGLTMVKKIIEISGGKIWVESEPGQGSTFFFTLPKAEIGVERC
ncbi:MAG: PAS domain S-box protein [Phycisphaerales bacterium]|jgi:PAS domain S-box-containing protein